MSISRVDSAVLQLRAQLQRLARERARGPRSTSSTERGPLERLQRERNATSSQDQEFRRKFVRALLTEELGEGLANQPEFERISNEVWTLLDSDRETRQIMDEALARLGS